MVFVAPPSLLKISRTVLLEFMPDSTSTTIEKTAPRSMKPPSNPLVQATREVLLVLPALTVSSAGTLP